MKPYGGESDIMRDLHRGARKRTEVARTWRARSDKRARQEARREIHTALVTEVDHAKLDEEISYAMYFACEDLAAETALRAERDAYDEYMEDLVYALRCEEDEMSRRDYASLYDEIDDYDDINLTRFGDDC